MIRTLLLFAALVTTTVLWGQEKPVDSLFDEPPPDSVADPNVKLTQAQLTTQKVRFFESVRAEGYYIAGWTGASEFVQSPYNALNFKFGSDARLDSNARAYASFYITYPTASDSTGNLYNPYENLIPKQEDLSFSNVQLREIFLDYTLGDAVFFRIGRENLTWGQGRIFNPANLVAGLPGGVGFRATSTVLGWNLSAVAIKNDGYYKPSSSLTSLDTLAVAGKAEGSWLLFSGGVSGFRQSDIGERGEAYLKTSLAGFDLFAEGLLERKLVKGVSAGSAIPSVLAGVYREFGDSNPWLQIEVEYLMSGRGSNSDLTTIPEGSDGWRDRSLGVGATSGLLKFVDTKPSLSWLHSFMDGSGQLLFGFTNTALPHLELSAGVVWIYGGVDGRYVAGNPDPLKRQIMATLKATFQFDIDN